MLRDMANPRVIIRDRGLKRFMTQARQIHQSEISVGVHDNPEIVARAIANEYGTDRIPERSFLRSTFDQEGFNIAARRSAAIRRIVEEGSSVREELRSIGAYLRDRIVAKINSGVPPPNAPSTIRRKGHGDTLRDTLKMRDGISVQVRLRNEKGQFAREEGAE